MTSAVASLDELFQSLPALGLARQRDGSQKADHKSAIGRAIIAVLICWVPLAVLSFVQSFLSEAGGLDSFLSDAGAHSRYLVAVSLLILAETVCAPRLGSLTANFFNGRLVAEEHHPHFHTIVASTRTLLASGIAQAALAAATIIVVLALIASVPVGYLAPWHISSNVSGTSYSLAGWWHVLVSLPLLVLLILRWLWRLCLWTRLLWLISRMDLRLVASHPDHMGGLGFISASARAYSIVAIALTAIVAGRVANAILHESASVVEQRNYAVAAVIVVDLMFAGPLLVFSGKLLREWRRGVLAYGSLARALAVEFEGRWFDKNARLTKDALEAPDFSAMTDLYQVASNVYAMRFIAVDLKSLLLLSGAAFLPFLPVGFLAMPLNEIFERLAKLVF